MVQKGVFLFNRVTHNDFRKIKKGTMIHFKSFSKVALLAISTAVMLSCNKKQTTVADTNDTGYASDQVLSEKLFDDVQVIADLAAEYTGTGSFKTTACGAISKVPNVITIDFGTTNCMCADGRNRRGKIIISYTGNYADSNSTHTIKFENYYQNDNKVEGTKTVTNMGRNSSGQPYFNVSVVGSITKPDGTVVTPNWARERTWIAGYNTPANWTDDEYKIVGSGTIIRSSGVVNVAIVDSFPLIIATNCQWVKSGSIVYTLPGGRSRTLNYGNVPACDNQATLTFKPSGTTAAITLP